MQRPLSNACTPFRTCLVGWRPQCARYVCITAVELFVRHHQSTSCASSSPKQIQVERRWMRASTDGAGAAPTDAVRFPSLSSSQHPLAINLDADGAGAAPTDAVCIPLVGLDCTRTRFLSHTQSLPPSLSLSPRSLPFLSRTLWHTHSFVRGTALQVHSSMRTLPASRFESRGAGLLHHHPATDGPGNNVRPSSPLPIHHCP
jgi:hypothetical protein